MKLFLSNIGSSLDIECSLLSSVGEVIVPGVDVLVGSGGELLDSGVVVSRRSVELTTVGDGVLLIGLSVLERLAGRKISQSSKGHGSCDIDVLEESLRSHDSREVLVTRVNLDHVGSVRESPSLSVVGVLGSVEVRSQELDMDTVGFRDIQSLRDKVVLNSRVALDDVSSSSSLVQVEDSGTSSSGSRLGIHLEQVRSVLEGTSNLVSVDCQSQSRSVSKHLNVWSVKSKWLGKSSQLVGALRSLVNKWVSSISSSISCGLGAVELGINEGVGVITKGVDSWVVGRGHVVSHSGDASLSNGISRDLPVVGSRDWVRSCSGKSGLGGSSVSKVVVSGHRVKSALRRSNSMSSNSLPSSSSSSTSGLGDREESIRSSSSLCLSHCAL